MKKGTNRRASAGAQRARFARPVKLVDLFAGAGGFSQGALDAGADVVGAIELNKAAAATYDLNIRRTRGRRVELMAEDILTLTPEGVARKWGLAPGACDIIVGGPPCQGFSAHRLNDSGVGDPRNELFARYFEFVAFLRPRIFLVENVPGLLWPRHAEYVAAFYSAATEAGYAVRPPVVLNARDYGVPQNRKRVFILGVDKSRPINLEWPPQSTHFDPALAKAPRRGMKPWVPARVAFRKMDRRDPNRAHMQHSAALTELFEATPRNGGSRKDSGRVLECHSEHNGHSDVYGRIDAANRGRRDASTFE